VTGEIVNPADVGVHLGPNPFPFFRFQDSATGVILLQKLDPDNRVAFGLLALNGPIEHRLQKRQFP
jgi:hypothetical protein